MTSGKWDDEVSTFGRDFLAQDVLGQDVLGQDVLGYDVLIEWVLMNNDLADCVLMNVDRVTMMKNY